MRRFECLLTLLVVSQVGLSEAAPTKMFTETASAFTDLINSLLLPLQRNLMKMSASMNVMNVRTAVPPPAISSKDVEKSAPSETVSIVVDPTSDDFFNDISIRSGFQEAELEDTPEAPTEDKSKMVVEQLFDNGPLYEYEVVTVKIPGSQTRFSPFTDNEIEQDNQGGYYRKIKVPRKRMNNAP